jgi:hypothetical protein
MGLHETKKLLHSKGNGHHTEEITYRMGEKSLSAIHLTRIYNIQGAQKLIPQRTINLLSKWANDQNR